MGKILIGTLIASIFCIATLTSCSTDGCTENQSSIPLAGFYSSENGTQISLDSLNIGGVDAPNDALLLESGTSAYQVYLPLRSTKNNTSFYINYAYKGLNNVALNDTIELGYSSKPYFVSEECGAMYRYRITSMKHTCHLIDSVVLIDSMITNVDAERIRIYFKTASPEQ